MAQRATVEELLTKKKPVTRTMEVVLDADIAERWQRANADLEQARHRWDQQQNTTHAVALQQSEDAVEELRTEFEAAAREVELQAIGRKAYDTLVAEHPPTKEQSKEAKRGNPLGELAFNIDTFPRALLAASLVDPKMTETEVDELFDNPNYNQAELTMLAAAALEINQNSKVITVSKGSGATRS